MSREGTEVCLNITKAPGWWGGAYGLFDTGAPIEGVTCDLSSVRKITFEAKASADGRTFNFNVPKATDGNVETSIAVGTEYKTFTVEVPSGTTLNAETSTIVSMATGTMEAGDLLYIKNITFYDASGAEIVPPTTR